MMVYGYIRSFHYIYISISNFKLKSLHSLPDIIYFIFILYTLLFKEATFKVDIIYHLE
jgi:hypothetical protein